MNFYNGRRSLVSLLTPNQPRSTTRTLDQPNSNKDEWNLHCINTTPHMLYAHTHMQANMHTERERHTHTHSLTHTHTHTNTHTHKHYTHRHTTHTHTHTQIQHTIQYLLSRPFSGTTTYGDSTLILISYTCENVRNNLIGTITDTITRPHPSLADGMLQSSPCLCPQLFQRLGSTGGYSTQHTGTLTVLTGLRNSLL